MPFGPMPFGPMPFGPMPFGPMPFGPMPFGPMNDPAGESDRPADGRALLSVRP